MKPIFRMTMLLLWLIPAFVSAWGCTSAIVSAKANPFGRPMLWKHRDTSATDNKVEYVPSKNGSHAYVALFNADDRRLEQAWTGFNDAGFAIMNTASYNLKDDNVSARKMDREGYLMTVALRTCRTTDDFQRLLETFPRPMGVEANFGVIDASGNGAFFETNNHSFKRYNLADAPDGLLIRTNYSHSGRQGEGYGFIRETNAEDILRPYAAKGEITPELLTETASRSYWHSLKRKDFADTSANEKWVVDQDFIPRYKSTATIVIEGCQPLENTEEATSSFITSQYIMWTGLGFPPCAEIVPVWCRPDGVDAELRGTGPNGRSPMCDKVKARRADVFPIRKGSGDKYIDMSKLVNRQGTGYLQILIPQNLEMYDRIRRLRDNPQ